MKSSRFTRWVTTGAIAGLTGLALSGCGLIYKPVGHTLNHYSLDEIVPYALGSGDLDLAACGTGMGLNQLGGSFSRVINRPARLMIVTNTTASFCSEMQAQKYHLLVQRNLHNGNTDVAQDNRIVAQRWERLTALRRYQVYNDTVEAYGEIGAEKCPNLSNELGTDQDEFVYLTGVLVGVQGLLNDIQANSSVGIPQNVAAKAGRASECIDNIKWWGVPKALEAVVWLSVPGNAPQDADPWAQLRQASAQGKQAGIALPAMLYALAAYGQSDTAREKEAIKMVADIYNAYDPGQKPDDRDEDNAAAQYLLLNQIAYNEALYLSDRIWIDDEGHRTPLVALGSFPGEGGATQEIDADSYLN
ncbi:hypothetical protein [Salinisphaera japonica]|uniref:Uncharacterized protein n=1 Tax=Salinisphaera japonica YTM-1 TaxID=1209778 RepID=A0A423PRL1_9GAMM|nr:hypothetical protein [Salinisphaera japonica]ROO28161.1 hypothetical protein SAJA_08650 [Salinisphaera japonica YTM-1]